MYITDKNLLPCEGPGLGAKETETRLCSVYYGERELKYQKPLVQRDLSLPDRESRCYQLDLWSFLWIPNPSRSSLHQIKITHHTFTIYLNVEMLFFFYYCI